MKFITSFQVSHFEILHAGCYIFFPFEATLTKRKGKNFDGNFPSFIGLV